MKSVTRGHHPSTERAVLTFDDGEVTARGNFDAMCQCIPAVNNVVLLNSTQRRTTQQETGGLLD